MTSVYDVFITYSRRADEELAALLQRELQRFAKPAFRRRALRVFRDDANLSANPGLWSSIQEALSSSRYLLVLASPEAAASPWVEKEVEHWRAVRPAGHVLLAITDGEMVWDEHLGDFDRARSTAVPASLAGAFAEEPRFVDLRVGEGQARLDQRDPRIAAAVADLAAPVHGRSKDDLVGEDLRQHRRLMRLTRAAVAVLTVLLLAAVVGVVLALVQRNEATTQRRRAESAATEAQRAAADSEFRRLANAASSAPTRGDALALAVAALAAADGAGRDEGDAVRPLVTALGRGDLPVLRFAGQSPGQYTSGERQGVDASLDGTTMAYIGNDGGLSVWDLVALERRLTISASEVGGAAEQLGLSRDGSTLVVLAYPPAVEPDANGLVASVVSVFDVTGTAARLTFAGELPVLSASAVAFGPDDESVLVAEGVGTIVVARHDGDRFASVRVGEPILTPSAGVMVTGFSLDGRRACTFGSGLQVYRIEPPERIAVLPPPGRPSDLIDYPEPRDPLSTGRACLPEPCGGSTDSFAVTTPGGWLRCLEPDGTDVTGDTQRYDNLASVAYAGTLGVPSDTPSHGWSVRPFGFGNFAAEAALANFVPPAEVATAASSTRGNEAGLMGARLVRAGEGVGLLTMDFNGLIELWSTTASSLEPEATMEIGDADVSLVAVPGPAGLAGAYALLVEEAGGSVRTRVFELHSGDEVGAWDRAGPPQLPDAAGLPVAVRMADAGTLVELLDDGTLTVHDLRSGTARSTLVPVSRPVAQDEADMAGDRVAFLDGDRALVVSVADGEVLADFEVRGDSCTDEFFPEETAFVDLAEDGDSLAIVRCDSDGRGSVEVARSIGRSATLESVDLRYTAPTIVSIASGGETTVVAFSAGQVGILRGGGWIEPDPLQAERASHNAYQRGWAAVDPAGRLLVTRRDAGDVELWSLDGPAVERVVRLADDDAPPPPAFAQFGSGSAGVTLAWDSRTHYDTGTTTAVTSTWTLERSFLLPLACRELTRGIPESAAAAGVTSLPACSEPASPSR